MDKNTSPADFEQPYTEEFPIEHRGRSKSYRFAELTEEDAQKCLGPDAKPEQFAELLVLNSVTDVDGTPFTPERLHKMPRAIVTKIQLKALEVNGYDAKAEEKAGES